MRVRLSLLLAIAALFCLVGWSGYAQNQSASKVTWEYMSVQGERTSTGPSNARLNELGSQGWELVSVTFGCLGESSCYSTAYFKRAR